MITPQQLKELYNKGGNISAYLRREKNSLQNTPKIIEISYDLQSGSYTEGMKNSSKANFQAQYSKELATIINSLCKPDSILEAGIGEATTLSGVLDNLTPEIKSFGFDISWSRVAYANKWLKSKSISTTKLCTGDLLNIPFQDNSIDIVFTSHAIEPNGGSEKPILQELYRVAKKYLILLEPGYEFASNEAKKRMDSHGYAKNIQGIATTLNYETIDHRLFPYTPNPLNPTAVTVIRKNKQTHHIIDPFACPQFKTPLKHIDNMLFSPEALSVYPIISGIPCLRLENSIIASKFQELMG